MLMSFTGNAIFGFSFLFSKLAMETADPTILLAVRFTAAFLFMNLLRILRLVRFSLRGKDLRPLLLLGLYQPICYFIFESYGIRYTSSSFAGTMIALIPIAGLALGAVLLKERPTFTQVLFSVLSVGGVIVMTAVGGMGDFGIRGFLFLVGAVFSGAMFSVQSRKTAEQFTAFERTYVMFGMGTAVFLITAIIRTLGKPEMWTVPLSDGRFWVSIIYLSCISSVGAFLLLNKALDVLDVARSLVFANAPTVISVLAGVLLLKEHFTAVQAVGIVMVIIGVWGVNSSHGNVNAFPAKKK